MISLIAFFGIRNGLDWIINLSKNNNLDTKSYFTKVVYTKSDFDDLNKIETLEKFMEDKANIPTKKGYGFIKWELVKGGTSNLSQVLDLLDAEYQAQWKSLEINIPSEEDNTDELGERTTFGIAYIPKQFNTEATQLLDLGKQSIPVAMKERFDIAVRYLRRVYREAEIIVDSFSQTSLNEINLRERHFFILNVCLT
ncbi:hypothetical protein ACE4W5_14065 [Enterococcus faecalis]|uniref:hypothetical protein n=1 Tax=Enterococcus faecalis TaxID=1351 RepID=UPI0035CB6655|nr:hypothetical protein [Enterococcus faecalis]